MSDLRSRLNKIIDLHGQALSEAIGQREPKSQEAELSNRDIILQFAENDPTDGKSRTQWLVKTYIQDEQFKLEDLGRAHAALAAFERFKRKLPVEQRELSRFKALRELEALVDPFVKAEARARLTRDLSTATGRELRRLECVKARDESIVLQEEDGLPTIAVPMTEFASKWWGRGTQWCTAAEKNNAFAQYHKNMPLVVIVCPDGAKFQMHVKKDKVLFMDNTDEDVSKKIIRERWKEFQSVLYWAIHQNEDVLQFVSYNKKSAKLYCYAINDNGLALRHVPEVHRTEELCRLAVEQNGLALEYVSKDKRTEELCRLAVEQDGWALHLVPKDKIFPKLCHIAVKQNGEALRHVPEKLITPELCRLAVAQNGRSLQWILEHKRAPELCRLAVEQSGWALTHIPEEHRTPELCRLAIERNGWALTYLSEEHRTPELCRLAIEQNGLRLHAVPENKKTLELCRLAVERNGEALQFVPDENKTSELCRLAVAQNGNTLFHVPEHRKTPELYRLAVEQNGLALRYVPNEYKTLELCRLAIEQNGEALLDVPHKYQTPEFLTFVSPVHTKWNLDILQGLGNQSQVTSEVTITT
jgi:Domain of unknown function (DUF4116)